MWYTKLKSKLANPDMLHVWMTFFIANVFVCLFKLGGAVDPLLYIILPPVLAWIVGVGVESFDGYYGTKQLEETGIEGNSFSTKDMLYDAVGAILSMITIAIMVL